MKPGHGEVLIAEGDVEVAEEEELLVQEFRRQLEEGMWAAVPDVALAHAGYTLTMRRSIPEPGVENQLVQRVGSGEEWESIRATLEKSPAITHVDSPFIRSAMIGAVKALDLVICNLGESGWLEKKVREILKDPDESSRSSRRQVPVSLSLLLEAATAGECVVDDQHDDGADHGNEHRIEIEPGNSGAAYAVEDEASDAGAQNA